MHALDQPDSGSDEYRAKSYGSGPENLYLDPHCPFEIIGMLFNLSKPHFPDLYMVIGIVHIS